MTLIVKCFLISYIYFIVFICINGKDEPQVAFRILTPEKFASVKPKVTGLSFCKGPKRRNCTNITFTANEDYTNVTFRVIFKESLQIMKSKLTYLVFQKDKEVSKIVKWIYNPCTHFFFGILLKNCLNLPKTCMVSKGNLTVNLNLKMLSTEVVSASHMIGKYQSQILILSKDCNVGCIEVKYTLESKHV